MAVDCTKYFSVEEVKRLRAYVSEHGNRMEWMLVDVALQTGLRVSEIAALAVGDFDLEQKVLHVIRAKKRNKRSKSNLVRDVLPIPDSLNLHVHDYLQWLHDKLRLYADQDIDPDTVFLWGRKGPIGKRGMQYAWDRIIEAAGVRHKSIHCGRHTLAVMLLKVTKNLRLVQKQLGHSSPTTTANFYADVPFEDRLEGLEAALALAK